MKNITIDINIKDIEVFKNLVELLEKYFDNLPKELQDKLKEAEENGINDIDADYALDRFGANSKIETSFKTDKIISINKILKKVKFISDDGCSAIEYPEHFFVKINDTMLVEW
jgi:hypothetical protein